MERPVRQGAARGMALAQQPRPPAPHPQSLFQGRSMTKSCRVAALQHACPHHLQRSSSGMSPIKVAPACSTRDVSTSLDASRTSALAAALQVTSEEAQQAVVKVPGLLRKSPSALRDKVQYIATAADMPLPHVAAILLLVAPHTLTKSPTQLLARLRSIEQLFLEGDTAVGPSGESEASSDGQEGVVRQQVRSTGQGTGLAQALRLAARNPQLLALDITMLRGLSGATARELRDLQQ